MVSSANATTGLDAPYSISAESSSPETPTQKDISSQQISQLRGMLKEPDHQEQVDDATLQRFIRATGGNMALVRGTRAWQPSRHL